MDKLNVAVIFGGNSSEYKVSLESASAVISNLNTDKWNPVTIGISSTGDWWYYTGPVERIKNDTWNDHKYCVPAVLSVSRNNPGLILLDDQKITTIPIDVALPVLHGRNGEDGTVQGMIALAGIPLAGCGVLASAICMDKDRAHKLVELAGIRVPKSMVITSTQETETALDFGSIVGCPLFVKPVKAGSSYGITKIHSLYDLPKAIETALQYDDEVIIEENIEGFEVGCAVLGTDDLITGEIDEIELSQGFFDYTEKYTLKTSAIHVPARINDQKAAEIKESAKRIYKALGCSGFARVDMFLTASGKIVFNEVNTIPGFTEHSRYPGMMKAAGLSFQNIIDRILGQAYEHR